MFAAAVCLHVGGWNSRWRVTGRIEQIVDFTATHTWEPQPESILMEHLARSPIVLPCRWCRVRARLGECSCMCTRARPFNVTLFASGCDAHTWRQSAPRGECTTVTHQGDVKVMCSSILPWLLLRPRIYRQRWRRNSLVKHVLRFIIFLAFLMI